MKRRDSPSRLIGVVAARWRRPAARGRVREMAGDGFDLVIIGAGVVGAAIAAAAASDRRSVLVIDAAAREGVGITSRSSGVIHSGLYYPPGSLKATTCLRGQELLYAWAGARGVAHARTGKLVVAGAAADEGALAALEVNAAAAGARGLRRVSAREARALEPALYLAAGAPGALWCPNTGIVDPHGLTSSLRAAAEARGALFAMRTRVTAITPGAAGLRIESGADAVIAGALVNAAGLDADRIAAMVGVDGYPIYPCRGDYFRLRTRAGYRRLIYPVRAPGSPGLGVHLTLDLGGGVRVGPDAEYVNARDDFRPAPAKHAAFHAAAEALLGPIDAEDLTYDGCGVRPKLRGPGEAVERDFVIHEGPAGCVHLVGIESPGLTAALALAELVVARL